MKNRILVFVMLAAVVTCLSSCCRKSSPSEFRAMVEPTRGVDGVQIHVPMAADAPVALWDDELTLGLAHVTSVDGEGLYTIVRDDSAATKGMVRMVYPASAIAGLGSVVIDTVQQSQPMGAGMVLYGESTADAPGEVALKVVSGIVRLDLFTPERLSTVALCTADSNRYMAGVFEVGNYPFPVLNATSQSTHGVLLTGLEEVDFSQHGDAICYVAPGCYHTLAVVMTTPDGRVCTKNLKEGKEVVVDRNGMVTIHLGNETNTLVFE